MAKVLVVDDNAEQLRLRSLILRKRGHEVCVAGSREEAVAAWC